MSDILRSVYESMKSIATAILAAFPWVLLFAVGLVMQGIQATGEDLPSNVSVLLYSVGGVAALIGSFGVGARIGREQTNDALRVKLATAFRRTARIYARMRVIQRDLGTAVDSVVDATTPREMVPIHVVVNGLDVVATRLDDEITTYDNALDEWHELVPAEVDKERQRLAGTEE